MQYKPCALILHSYNFHHGANEILKNWYNQDLRHLGYKAVEETEHYIMFTNSFSDIYLTKPVLENDQMKRLYTSANVGISFCAAEGWGLPQMEMMACGKPVIISNVIGHKEYIKDLPVFQELIIEPIGKEVANDGVFFHGDRGNWYTLSQESLISKLNYAYDNNIGSILSRDLSEYIINNYNWNLAATKIKQIITEGTYEN